MMNNRYIFFLKLIIFKTQNNNSNTIVVNININLNIYIISYFNVQTLQTVADNLLLLQVI